MYRSFFEFHSVLILDFWLFLHLINLILLSELIVSAIQKKKHLQFQENEKIQDKMDQMEEVVLFFLISYYIYNCFLPV